METSGKRRAVLKSSPRMIPNTLLQKVLRRLDLIWRTVDGDHSIVATGNGFFDGDVRAGLLSDLADARATMGSLKLSTVP